MAGKQHPTSLASRSIEDLVHYKPDQFKFPTWGAVIVLIAAFIILKMFIYIKDSKRHGK
ncbi:MAG: hypothetical protein HOE90_23650 [Bacteriovoracaceae bacterium]|jgi:hypothetical protein|nr:hypothetical protein [Bacteriovoracaceae bacterium]